MMGNDWGGDDHDCVMHIVMITAVVMFVRLIDNGNSGDGGENVDCNDGGWRYDDSTDIDGW